MSEENHIADAENTFLILNVNPDFCQVGNSIVPFDIARTLVSQETKYAKTVFARSEPVLMVESLIQGVTGNAGAGIASGVSGEGATSQIIQGSGTVFAESRQVARHLDLVKMNVGVR